MYASFVRNVSFPFYAWWTGSDLLRNTRVFERSQWFSPERLKDIRWSRLQMLLHHAYQNVPYYRETFKSLGAVPEDIRSFEDFAKFPTLTKQTIQARLGELIASNVPRTDLLKGVTSGSSGTPTYYIQQRSSNRIRVAAGKRLTRLAGYDFGLKVFYLWRDSPFVIEGDQVGLADTQNPKEITGLRRFKKALHSRFLVENPTIRVDPTLMTDAEMSGLYQRLRSFRPDIIVSYVSTLYMFAQYLHSERLSGIRPKSLIVSSETLYPYQRELMEKVFGCNVYNRYGLSETGIVAIECPVRQGLHLNEEILHLEYSATAIGNSQLVITDLINFGMPLLRYETGDTGRPISEPCPCGRGLSRIGELSGRIIDLLPTKLGGFVNGQLFATFHWIEGVKQYQVIQEKIDRFRLRIARTSVFEEGNLNPILKTIREKFGPETSIEVEYLENIPFTQGGKYKLVVSEVKNNGR